MSNDHTGYATYEYAAAVAGGREIVKLPRSGAHLLLDSIPGAPGRFDAVAPYPFLACRDWSGLPDDLADLPEDVVAVMAVVDPLGDWTDEHLGAAFTSVLRPFKSHVVVKIEDAPPSQLASAHHRRNIRKAREQVAISERHPSAELDDAWPAMYASMIDRVGGRGSASDFSRSDLLAQMRVPGMRIFVGEGPRGPTAIALWVLSDSGDAYYHLGASSPDGYAQGASFALFADALDVFHAEGLHRVFLGSAPGVDNDPSSGVLRFKRGWSRQMIDGRLGGRILDVGAYRTLSGMHHSAAFFPAYRAPRGSTQS